MCFTEVIRADWRHYLPLSSLFSVNTKLNLRIMFRLRLRCRVSYSYEKGISLKTGDYVRLNSGLRAV